MKPAQKARDGDIRFVTVLLKEEPREHARARQTVAGHQRRFVGEVADDRIRFRQIDAGLDLEHRNLAVGIPGEKLGRARLAFHGVDFDPFIRQSQGLEDHTDLVTVAGQ
jgi:hypothetical protein